MASTSIPTQIPIPFANLRRFWTVLDPHEICASPINKRMTTPSLMIFTMIDQG